MPGAPNMKMYSREDLMNNNFAGDDDADDDEDEDEDDNEGNFPNNLVKPTFNTVLMIFFFVQHLSNFS
jgi:hypothetical protein